MRVIDADFNMLDEQGRFWLYDAAFARVHRGEKALLTDGEMDVEATLDYDDSRQIWVGSPDRSTFRVSHRLVTST